MESYLIENSQHQGMDRDLNPNSRVLVSPVSELMGAFQGHYPALYIFEASSFLALRRQKLKIFLFVSISRRTCPAVSVLTIIPID